MLGAFDVIVVLTGDPNPAQPELLVLADEVAAAFHQGLAPSVVTTGCCHHSLDLFPGRTEAQIFRDLLLDREVPEGNIFCEEHSADLIGRIVHSQLLLLDPCSWYHLLIFCPGSQNQPIQPAIEACFGDDYHISWQTSAAVMSDRHAADLKSLLASIGTHQTSQAQLQALAKTCKAKGLPESLQNFTHS